MAEKENWKTISNPDYQISDKGNARNRKTKQVLKKQIDAGGYYIINLGGKSKKISRLVAVAFIENPNNLPIVDHIDRNKLNNNITNLRWVTHVENSNNRNYKNDMRVTQKSLDNSIIKIWNSVTEIYEALKYTRSIIRECCNKKKNNYKNFKWEWFIERTNSEPRLTIVEDIEGFIMIGKIDEYDFSDYKIKTTDEITIINNKNILVKPHRETEKSYYRVSLKDRISGKMIHKSIHHLVYAMKHKTFPKNGVVDHLDENKSNNNVDNLELVTSKINTTRATGKKVNQIDIKTNTVLKTFDSVSDAYRHVKNIDDTQHVRNTSIADICNGKYYSVYGYKWEWADEEYRSHVIKKELSGYKSIGIIDSYDFSAYRIKEEPDISIINNKDNIMKPYRNSCNSNFFICLYDDNKKQKVYMPLQNLIYAIHNKIFPTEGKIVIHKDDNKANNKIGNLKLINQTKFGHTNSKRVNQISLETNQIIQTFNSLTQAAKAVNNGKGDSSISAVCNKTQKTAYGYKWEFAD